MHEWHLIEELLDEVCSRAKENQLNRVTKVRVDLGKDSHITAESLRFCFQLLGEKTLAREAVLEIEPAEGSFLSVVSFEGE